MILSGHLEAFLLTQPDKHVAECTGVQTVQVSLKRGRVVVEGNNLDSDRIMSAIDKLGYRPRILSS